MDTFDEMMKEGKMDYEPSPDFTDRVMGEIQNESHNTHEHAGARRGFYALAGIAASILVVTLAVTVVTLSNNGSEKNRNIAINTSTSTSAPTSTSTTAPSSNPNAVLASEFDEALTSMDSEMASDIKNNTFQTSSLNNDGI